MTAPSTRRRVVVLAPMPLEMHAITTAFGLTRANPTKGAPWMGHVGNSDVTAIHIGMGPPLTRVATQPDYAPVDHVMVAGICGGLGPDLPVGTLINAEYIIEATSGTEYRHTPPGDEPLAGKIITTEGVSLDIELSKEFRARGCLGVDMENSAVAEVCEANGCAWSVYRCIGDRWFDGLLDQRVIDVTNPDGSGNQDALGRLLAAEPDMADKLRQLSRDTTLAARLAAEAAVRGCLALDD